jgi:hypothetical protein
VIIGDKPKPIAVRVATGEERATQIEERVARIERMNVAQCKVLGVTSSPGTEEDHAEPGALDRLVTFATSREGRNLGLRVVTLVLAALAASHAGNVDDLTKAAAKLDAPALVTPTPTPYGAPDGGVK